MANKNKLLQFPTHFPMKIFGPNSDDFIDEIWQLALEHFPKLKKQDVKHKPSENSNYIAITINLYVQSQVELDALYIAVNKHPDTKMVL